MADLNRRDFFKALGLGSVAGAAGCASETTPPFPLDVQTPVEKLLPYVVQPEQITPGVPTFFATVCGGCSASCGAIARNREGRVVFLGGNPDAPQGGGLCASGVGTIQDVYDPDRVTAPTKGGAALTWDAALDAASKAVGAARGTGKVAWLGRYRTGAISKLIGDFVSAVGGRRLHWEPLGYESIVKATELAFGVSGAPRYVLDDAQIIVGFGADFLHTWLDGVSHSAGWAKARDPKHGGFVAEFVEIAPRVTHTGTRCDQWLATRPGTEAGVAMALAKLVAEKRNSNVAQAWLSAVVPGDAAAAAGVGLDKLQALADKLAQGPSVVFPGGIGNNGVSSTELAVATLVLNAVCGNIGRSVRLTQHTNLGVVSSYNDVVALLNDAAAGNIDTLFIDDLNPVFALPAELKAADALNKVPNLFILGTGLNESVTPNATVLPMATALESWGDAEPVIGFHGLQQPGMKPLGEARAMGDVLLAMAAALSLEDAVAPVEAPAEETPAAKDGEAAEVVAAVAAPLMVNGKEAKASLKAVDFHRYVAGYWNEVVFAKDGTPKSFDKWWVESLQRGGFFTSQPEQRIPLRGNLPKASGGAAVEGMALMVFPHAHLFDGRGANKAWLQEIPDPVSGYAWTSWAEISPKTAAGLGVTNADTLVVTANGVDLEVGVRVSKGMQDNAVAVVLGNGHTEGSRYARGFGANAFRLLPASADPISGAWSMLGGTAQIKRGGGVNVNSLKGSEDMDGRPIALTSVVAQVLSGEHHEPGSLAPVHKIPEDPRLVEKGMHDMFPEPEHPTYRFALSVDLDSCTGCGACEAACMSENNISVVGPEQHKRWRQMGWIRLDRFWEGEGEHPDVRYMPAMCQQCSHAPCEGVCPVLATYHSLDGLNAMIYNRCVGTRYCANNCPYSARRFNFHTYRWPEAYELMLNPDVSTREMGVMEKCTFCVQRIRYAKAEYRDQGPVPDVALRRLPACAEVCPSGALVFGNAKDSSSLVADKMSDPRAYTLLGELNTKPGVRYLTRLSFQAPKDDHHGGGHGAASPDSHSAGDAAGTHH